MSNDQAAELKRLRQEIQDLKAGRKNYVEISPGAVQEQLDLEATQQAAAVDAEKLQAAQREIEHLRRRLKNQEEIARANEAAAQKAMKNEAAAQVATMHGAQLFQAIEEGEVMGARLEPGVLREVSQAKNEAREAAEDLVKFNVQAEHDAEIRSKTPAWEEAINGLHRDFREMPLRGEDPMQTVETAARIVEALHTAEGLPEGAHPVFIVTKVDEKNGLEVRGCSHAAMELSARVRPTARWEAHSSHALTVAAFSVLNSGEPRLAFSPNGESECTYDLFPLLERTGECFGVLVSGTRVQHKLTAVSGKSVQHKLTAVSSIGVQHEFTEELSRHASKLLEEAWRNEQRQQLDISFFTFLKGKWRDVDDDDDERLPLLYPPPGAPPVKRQSTKSSYLRDRANATVRSDGAINFATDFGMTVELLLPTTAAYKQRLRDKKQQTSVSSSKQKEFRPFAVTDKELSFFEHECIDLAGKGTGIVQISRTDGRPWSSYMLGMLMAMFDARQATLLELERTKVGDTPRTLKYGRGRPTDGAIARAELLLPYKMQDQLRANLAEMPAHQLVAELRNYHTPVEEVCRIIAATLCLLGKVESHKADWKVLHPAINRQLIDDMLDKDMVGGPQLEGHRTKEDAKRWRESKRALKGLELDEVTKKAGYATRVLAAWAQTAHLLNSTAGQIRRDEEEKRKEAEDAAREMGEAEEKAPSPSGSGARAAKALSPEKA